MFLIEVQCFSINRVFILNINSLTLVIKNAMYKFTAEKQNKISYKAKQVPIAERADPPEAL